MVFLILLVLLLTIIVLVLWWSGQSNKNKSFYKIIPTPPTVPILGNALDLLSTTELLSILLRYVKDFGGTLRLKIGPIHSIVVVSDYKFLECILSSTKLLNKSDEYDYMRLWLGTGLLTSDGLKWKKHRRILTPAFHFQILEQFIGVFESCGERLTQKLEREAGKDSVDIYPYVTLCALDVICESTMGIRINAQDDESSDYVRSVKDMTRILVERSMRPIEMYNLTYPLTKNYYTQKKALRVLHQHTNSVIKKRREELENKVKNEEKPGDFVTKRRKAFLDLLLETTVDGRPLTQEEIREEVDTFMFEGHDTTASGISFTLFCLANHPDVQKRAFEEQQTIFDGNKNPDVTYADLQNMKYLEMVIKETLRLYPSVPLYGRKGKENVEFGNTKLPEGDTLMIFAFGIHRNPEYFDDPEKFDPSRFETIDGKLPYAYIPFSAGPRNCIGQKFAMLEMKSTVSRILRKFEIEAARPRHVLKLSAESILKSANGIKIGLRLRC